MASSLPTWAVALLILLAIALSIFLLYLLLLSIAPSLYKSMIASNSVSVDDFVGGPPSPSSALKSWLLNRLNVGGRQVRVGGGYNLKVEESDKLPGLKVTSRNDSSSDMNVTDDTTSEGNNSTTAAPPIVVGTIRMGFGHHRIAYATASWGLAPDASHDRSTWFHDFLNIDSEEAQMIKDTDKLYSKGSRLASELGGYVEKFWGSLTKSGDEDSLRVTYQFSEHMVPLLSKLDKNSPIIATHSMVACAAVAAGFTNVINLVIDNHAQWFVVVPGALNLVQGPSNYHSFLKMGVPEECLGLAGHWIPRDLVEGIPSTCQWRIDRKNANKPLRIIIPVGGAGAQRKFIVEMVGAFAGLVKQKKVQLFLNAGDHEHMKEAFLGVLREFGMEYDTVVDMKGVQKFRKDMVAGEPAKNVTLVSQCQNKVTLCVRILWCLLCLRLKIICLLSSRMMIILLRLPQLISSVTYRMYLHVNRVNLHFIPYPS